MFKRIITSIIWIPILIIIVNSGGEILLGSTLILTSVGLWEYCKTINSDKQFNINFILEIILGIFIVITLYYKYEFTVAILVLCLIIIFIYEIFSNHTNILQGIYSIFGLIYVPLLLGHILLFERIQYGNYYIWLVFIIAFSTDTFAYFIGIKLGRHKLCPKISPKKSVEGAIGGIIGSIIITTIYGYVLYRFYSINVPLIFYIYLAGSTSIVSQCGDLTASMLKRKFNTKDFGKFFPGHGGVLDRFDSILFTTPVIYYFITIFLKNIIEVIQ